jgi:hypothetical protein
MQSQYNFFHPSARWSNSFSGKPVWSKINFVPAPLFPEERHLVGIEKIELDKFLKSLPQK